MSDQLYTQRHNGVCGVMHRNICKNFNIPAPQNSWKRKAKAIIENKNIMLAYNLMIPFSVNITNKALQPNKVVRYKKQKKALLIEVSVPSGFDPNNSEIKKIPGNITTNKLQLEAVQGLVTILKRGLGAEV